MMFTYVYVLNNKDTCHARATRDTNDANLPKHRTQHITQRKMRNIDERKYTTDKKTPRKQRTLKKTRGGRTSKKKKL